MKKTYKVWLKPCEEYPDGSWCVDPRNKENEADSEGWAVFYTKKGAKELIKYFCKEWVKIPKDAYEIVCSHEVRYCVFDYAGKECRIDMLFNTKREAEEVLKLCQADCPDSKDDFVVAEILIPKKKES